MITVKKDAIKYKNADGQMESAGVLCKVGTFGVDNMKFMTQWGSTFYQASFPEETHLVLEYGDNFGGAMTSMFAYTGSSKIKSIKIVGSKKVTSVTMNSTFNNCSAEIIDFSECDLVLSIQAMQNTFSNCTKLKKIKGTLDVSQVGPFVAPFKNFTVLEEVRFLKENIFKTISFSTSPKLSDASKQSIINGLATVETTQTLVFHPDVFNGLTEEQKAQATSKNWTIARG